MIQTLFCLTFLTSSLASFGLYAASSNYSVSPTNISFSAQKNQEWVTIENSAQAQEPIALEVQVLPRQQDLLTGAPILKEDIAESKDGPFLVSPNKAVLFPGESQMISVRSLSAQAPAKETVYSLLVRQVPLPNIDPAKKQEKVEGARGVVNTFVNYEGAIYLVPSNPKPDVQVVKLSQELDEKKSPLMRLELTNNGTGKQMLNKPFTLKVSFKDATEQSLTIKPEDFASSKYAIYPGSQRVITLAWPASFKADAVKTHILFEKE